MEVRQGLTKKQGKRFARNMYRQGESKEGFRLEGPMNNLKNWSGLKKSWVAFRQAKQTNDPAGMSEGSRRMKFFARKLGILQTSAVPMVRCFAQRSFLVDSPNTFQSAVEMLSAKTTKTARGKAKKAKTKETDKSTKKLIKKPAKSKETELLITLAKQMKAVTKELENIGSTAAEDLRDVADALTRYVKKEA